MKVAIFLMLLRFYLNKCKNKKSPANIKPPVINAKAFEFYVNYQTVKKIVLEKTSKHTI